MSCLLTQQMSWLQTQEMSCLQTQQMSCLQTQQAGLLQKTQGAQFKGATKKMVFGRNLHLMAPFEFLEAGFCTEFRRASFVFSCPGADFCAQDWIVWTWGRRFGPGTFLG